jgi:hypothetical protein
LTKDFIFPTYFMYALLWRSDFSIPELRTQKARFGFLFVAFLCFVISVPQNDEFP